MIYDNRCLIHCATWYDTERLQQRMWRTTVRGSPGLEYVDEARSWIPKEAAGPMAERAER